MGTSQPDVSAHPVPFRAPRLTRNLGRLFFLIGDALAGLFSLDRGRMTYLNKEIIQQIYFTAVQSVYITITVGFILGILITLPLLSLGVGDLTFVAFVYENAVFHSLLPVLVTVIIIGRSGTAITAELSNLVINDSIDTFLAMGIEPNHFLVLPRLIGVTVSILMMVVWMAFFTVLGTGVMMYAHFGLGIDDTLVYCADTLDPSNTAITLYMLACIGFCVASLHCYYGFKSKTPIELSQILPKAYVRSFLTSLTIVAVFSLTRAS